MNSLFLGKNHYRASENQWPYIYQIGYLIRGQRGFDMDTQDTVLDRLSDLCQEEHTELLNGLNNRTAWSKEGDLGYGNQVVSAAHDNRTVLELIQNARDAIVEGDGEEDGRVAVIVGPESLRVANSGEPFHLDDDDVFEAVTSLGRSSKASSRGSIGEKGVGLKSLLQRSEAFSIHSSIGTEQFSARFSRARTAKMLLSVYGTLLDEESFVDALEISDTQGEIIDSCQSLTSDQDVIPDYIDTADLVARLLTERRQSPPTPASLLSDLPRLSLFRYPFLASNDDTESAFQRELIHGHASTPGLAGRGDDSLTEWVNERQGEFSTVVELDYLDHQWRDLLDQIDDALATADEDAATTFRDRRSSKPVDREAFRKQRQQEFWQECTDISPETLILLGRIEELDLIRVTRDESGALEMADRRQITIDRGSSEPLEGHSAITRRSVDYTVQRDGQDTLNRQYRRYTRTYEGLVSDEESTEPGDVHLLFERPPESIAEWAPSAKPLYLHYPIEEETTPFPFVIHAPFRVEFDRQSLADDAQNQRVLDHLPELAASAAVDLASGTDSTHTDGDPFSSWMPWVTMPLQTESDNHADGPVREGIQDSLAQLRDAPIVPVANGDPQAPSDTLLDPQRLLAFETLRRDAPGAPIPSRTVIESGRKWQQCVSSPEEETLHSFRQCASRLGLTDVLERLFDDEASGDRGCIDILCEHWGLDSGDVPSHDWAIKVDDVEHATSYFEAIRSVLTSKSDDEESAVERAAARLGDKRVPLIPAEAHQEESEADGGVTHLVRARSRRDTQRDRGTRRSERIVFRRTGGGQTSTSIISELPSPPTSLPVYVVPFRDEWVGALERFNRDWGTRKLDSPAEFYRRVAAEAGGYSGESTSDPAVISYLAALYETVTRGQLADWLQPRPHRHHQFDDVESTLSGASTTDLPSDYDDYLEQRYMQRVELPVQGTGETLPAEQITFGAEWVAEFEAVAEILETADATSDRFYDAEASDGSRAATFRRWAAVIENASAATPAETPTVAGPADSYWEQLFDSGHTTDDRHRVRRLDFLIHLGVQIGPRIDWRWVLPTRGENDRGAGTLTVSEAQSFAHGDHPAESDPDFEVSDDLLESYRDVIWRSDNHPAFTAEHSSGCGNNWLECDPHEWTASDSREAVVPVWWYFTDLPEITDDASRTQYRDSILLLWPELSEVAEAAWLCSNWHSFKSSSGGSLPALGTVQLANQRLWPAEGQFEDDGGDDRLTVESGATFPAERLILNQSEQARGAAQYLPRANRSALKDRIAAVPGSESVNITAFLKALGIREIDDLTPPMAATRLDRFLTQFAVTGPGTPRENPFEITADWSSRALSVPIDALMRRLASESELAPRLDDQSTIRQWIRRDIWHLGTSIRITEGRTSKGYRLGADAPAVDDGLDTFQPVVFSQPLSSFSRERLVRDSRPFVERPADTTELAYLLGDDEDAAEVTLGVTVESEPPKPRPVQGGNVESGSERLEQLQSTLQNRREYLLAAYLKHATSPNLEEIHDTLSAVTENQIAIVEREAGDDTQRNSAQWQPADQSQRSTPHIALFEDAVERVDGESIPPYLAADGIVQALEQFDLTDTFENVLFKGESTLETEYRDALADVREEITELRAQRLETVSQALGALVSTLASDVSLTPVDDADPGARETLRTIRELDSDEATFSENALLQSWIQTLTEECGLDLETATECLRAAATDDDALRHRIIYRLDRVTDAVDVDALVDAGHRWERLSTWPTGELMRPVKRYGTAIARLRQFWETVNEYADSGESVLERAARDARDVSVAPEPHRRVARVVPNAGTLDPEIRARRLGSLPDLETDPTPLEQLSDAVSEWVSAEWADLNEADVIYTDPQIEKRMQALIEASADPHTADEEVVATLSTFIDSGHRQSTGEGRTREDLTTDWILNRDDSIDSTTSRVSTAGAVTEGGSPSISDSSGSMYGQPNVEIDARGREGELICLNRAWDRFQSASPAVRSAILDCVRSWREHEPWRLASVDEIADSWTSPTYDGTQGPTDPVALLEAADIGRTSAEKAAFHAVFDTSAERGPGFDLIDPFGAMPDGSSIDSWDPTWVQRVESKAVAAEQMQSGRIKLTGNELRMALRSGPASTAAEGSPQYVVRLVGFTTDWRQNNDETVQLLDIDNVGELVGVDQTGMQLLEKLRGGSFYVTFHAGSA